MRKLLLATSMLSAFSAMATDMEPGTIKSDAELGVILTSGNTETTSFKVKVDSKHELENWRNQYIFDVLYKEDEVETDGNKATQKTAQKLFASAQANYKLMDPNKAIFLFTSYEDDRFSGFDYQASVAAGYNHKVWSDKESSFEYNIGPGYSFNKTDAGENENSLIVRAAAAYTWQISDSAKFSQTLSSEIGEETKSKSETSVSAKINGSLQMKFAFIAKHNSGAPADKESLDTETAVTLVYSF